MSTELKTVKQCMSKLETALLALDRELVHFLNNEGFLTDEAHDEIPSLTENKRAGELVKWIKNRVQQDQMSYHTLVDWLKNNSQARYRPIVECLETEYEKLAQKESQGQTHRSRGLSEDSAFASTSSAVSSNITSPTSLSPVFQATSADTVFTSTADTSSEKQPFVYSDDVKQQLSSNLKTIRQQYSSYVNCVRKSIKERSRNISVDDLRASLLNLPAFTYNRDEKQLKLLSGKTVEFDKADTIDDIFKILSCECCSFLDYEIFQSIVEEFDLDEGQEKLKYPEYLKMYAEWHKLSDSDSEFIQINPSLKEKITEDEKLVLKFDIKSTCTLAHLKELKTTIASILELRPSALRILDIEEGCVLVTFLISAPIAYAIFSGGNRFTSEQIDSFRSSSVLWLKYCDIEYDFKADIEGTKDDQTKEMEECSMITAAKNGDLSLVKKLLGKGVDPNARENDEYAWSALHWACDCGHTDIVDYLLDHRADADAQDSKGWTGLILASRRGYLRIVNRLLDKGADVHKVTKILWGALQWTAQEGHTEVAKLLLERGATATTQDKCGFTPLTQASQDGHLNVVKVLVEHSPGMDMNQITNSGWSAVMVATKNGHEDVVRYLVDHGSDVYYRKKDRITALHIAGYKGHNSIVRYFCLSKKMNVNAQDEDGVTPLMFAVRQGKLDVVRTLVENGMADVNIEETANRWTAAFFAVESHKPMVLDYLLRIRRVDVTHKDDIGNTIVDLAKIINPDALECLSKYHKTEMETMSKRSRVAANYGMQPYEKMLRDMDGKIKFTQELGTIVSTA